MRAGGREAAPRGPHWPGDWARGSGPREEKLRSRFRDRESGRRDGEKGERQRRGGEGIEGARRLGAAASRSLRIRDGLTAVACADPQPQGTKKGEGGRGRGKRSAAGRRAGARGAGGGGGASASAAHPGTCARLGGGCRGSLASSGWGMCSAQTTFAPPRGAPCVRCKGGIGAGARTSVTSQGRALPVMWLEAGGRKGWAGRGRRKCEGAQGGKK